MFINTIDILDVNNILTQSIFNKKEKAFCINYNPNHKTT